jgi:light-independent protochlorophyllide reductase subunit B
VHPLMMGLEEHLLHMFRDDAEFHDAAGASHLGATAAPPPQPVEPSAEPAAGTLVAARPVVWDEAAEKELKKIPFFVRGKARRNTEQFASERGLTTITVDTLYDAKAHFGR